MTVTSGTSSAQLPGVQCNPEEAEIEWWEPVHDVLFRLLAGPDLAGAVIRGAVRVWCGPLIIGEVSIAVRVAAGEPAAEPSPVAEPVRRYRKIFPSYSHHDRAMVATFAEAARALGDRYLQDVVALRAGERWDARLLELIEDADVFQLFWSRNSMRSPYCQEEWEHALALQRPLFVRPLYWEEPLPEDPGQELPPAALRALHFVKVPVIGSELAYRSAPQPPPPSPDYPQSAAWWSRPGRAAPSSPPPAPSRPSAGETRTATPARSGGRRSTLVLGTLVGLLLVTAVVLAILIAGR
jgi:TIR domain